MLDCVVDLSHFQGDVDFFKVKNAGIQAVILKATQGIAWIDPCFIKNMTNALANGLMVGAYHFGTSADAKSQADHFLSVAGNVPLRVLDFEENLSSQMSPTQANEFVQRVTAGKFPMIYADFSHLQQLQIFPLIAQDCPLWIAQYKDEDEPNIPNNSWDKWTLWQYTQNGAVDGVSGKVDRSYFNGSLDDLKTLFSS